MRISSKVQLCLLALFCAIPAGLASARAQTADNDHTKYKTYSSKPNIVEIISDDTGYWDLGAYGGDKARGMDTPNFDQMARDGMMFTDLRPALLYTRARRHDDRALIGGTNNEAMRDYGRLSRLFSHLIAGACEGSERQVHYPWGRCHLLRSMATSQLLTEPPRP